jgi:hypothetical protein
MGILNGSKALFSLNGLSLNHVTEIAKKMAEVNGRAGGHPRICIDASWLERKARNRCAEIIGILKEDGFAITVVFDPPSRHHSKVVSISRCGKRENARLDYYAARFQAKLVSEELSKGSLSNDERVELEKELEKLHSKARTKEDGSVSSLVRPSFVEDLKEQITKLPPSRFGSVASCTTGSYQADSVISRLVEKGECDLVFSSDSDFSFVGGTKCVQLVDFKLTKGKLAKISIKTATRGTMDQAVNAANSLQSPRTLMSCVKAEFPILDEVDDPRLRCAIAVILGSDTFPGGVPNVGASKVMTVLLECNKQITTEEMFVKAIAMKSGRTNFDSTDLQIATDALLFEPTNEFDEQNVDSGLQYIFEEPQTILDGYLHAFDCHENDSPSNDRILTCHGHASMGEHQYLRCFARTCSTCTHTCCKFCMGKKDDSIHTVLECLKCKAGDIPEDDNTMTSEQLRKEIAGADYNLQQTEGTITELQELHEEVVTKKALEIGGKCKYPLQQSKVIHDNNAIGAHVCG